MEEKFMADRDQLFQPLVNCLRQIEPSKWGVGERECTATTTLETFKIDVYYKESSGCERDDSSSRLLVWEDERVVVRWDTYPVSGGDTVKDLYEHIAQRRREYDGGSLDRLAQLLGERE
jgi:hypothetical protein